MKQSITIEAIATCKHCGKQRELVNEADAVVIEQFLEKRGKSLEATAREFRPSPCGGFLWSHGMGYAIFDEDLLGGDGTGRTEDEFTAETGMHIKYVGGNGKFLACPKCAEFL